MKKLIILLVAILFLFTACNPGSSEPTDAGDSTPTELIKTDGNTPTPSPTEKPTEEPTEEPAATQVALPVKVAVVVARNGYQEYEFNPVYEALTVAGYEPVIVSDQTGTAKGNRESVEIEAIFNDLTGAELRGIVIIGGEGVTRLWENPDLHRLINEVDQLQRVVAAICLAPVTLSKSGAITQGEEACWFNSPASDSEMQKAGVVDSGKSVTISGNIITGNGPEAAEDFAASVVAALDDLS
mgnify:CR=1 FL=1